MYFWSKSGDTSLNGWQVMMRTSSKWDKFWLLSWIWPWRSRSINSQNNMDLNRTKIHFWSKYDDSNSNGWKVIVRTSSEWGKIRLWRSINPKNNGDLNQCVLQLWSKLGDSSLNVIVRTSKWLMTHTDTRNTHRRRRWQYPKVKTGLG